MPFLKTEAPPDVLDVLTRAEATADDCWRSLQIRYYPSNIAVWALLTASIRAVEREHAVRGSATPHFRATMINVSRSLAIAVKWAIRHGQAPVAPLNPRWSGELSVASEQALSTARNYSTFEMCFPAFHKLLYAAEVLAPRFHDSVR